MVFRTFIPCLIALLVASACTGGRSSVPDETRAASRTFSTNDPVTRGCGLSDDILTRIWRGHHPVHSEDVTIVPQAPNYSGSFSVTSHSGPWDYVQTVPLVLYGPGHIAARGRIETEATVADIYPTVGDLTNVDLPRRSGRTLRAAVRPSENAPKLFVLVVWDGVGRNVMDLWPDRWPTVKRLERRGTSYVDATVGSSPSITPATHATMGTGAFPRDHGVTAIEYRTRSGEMRGVYAGRDPGDLRRSTFGDDVDAALANQPKVGMIAWKSWHLGMLSHGTQMTAGDADHLGLIGHGTDVTGNPRFYSTPGYLSEVATLPHHAEQLDREDGNIDEKWRGHPILEMHDNPAWVEFQTDVMLSLLRNEGYGQDEIPDIFVTNYKVTDIVSHQHSITSPEMGDVIEAQDRALQKLVQFLDDKVGDYVIALTADHGNTLPAAESGGWPLLQGQLEADVNKHFGAPKGKSLLAATTAVGPFLDRDVAAQLGVTAQDVARFLNGYTIRANWGGKDLPDGYRDRGAEHVLSAAFAKDQLDEIVRCRFNAPAPPGEAGG